MQYRPEAAAQAIYAGDDHILDPEANVQSLMHYPEVSFHRLLEVPGTPTRERPGAVRCCKQRSAEAAHWWVFDRSKIMFADEVYFGAFCCIRRS